MFEGRHMLIATMHSKEEVLAPLFEKEMGVKCVVMKALNTDELGTFSGEVERVQDALSTVRAKALMALDSSDYDLVLASEGSFGSHPSLFFVPANDEIVLLLDRKNNLEISGRFLSSETNFNGSEIRSEKELKEFASKVAFPSHGLILRPSKDDLTDMRKGITDWETLEHTFLNLMEKHGKAYAETDMRAMYNPSRMKVIEQAAIKLLEKIKSLCPECSTPGFSVTKVMPGLPCEWCNSPTNSTLKHIYSCSKCGFARERYFPHGKQKEEPGFCDFCNP